MRPASREDASARAGHEEDGVNPKSDLPWDRRPLTARDFAVTVLLGIVGLGAVIGLIVFVARPQAEGAAPEPAQPPPAAAAAQGGTGIGQTGSGQAGRGQDLFEAKCASCHTIGGGDLVGPDLQGITERRDRAWLEAWIADPVGMVQQGDPIATQLLEQYSGVQMPDMGLSEAEVAAVLDYLSGTEPGGPAPTAAAPQQALAGDPAAGHALFTGNQPFENGGPSCMACHSVSGIGALGGGALGPDLTGVVKRYGGAAGLSAFLNGLPTPTMQAVWARQPLTAQEQADLVAFLQRVSIQERPPQVLAQLLGLSLGGVALLVGVGAANWRKRLTGVRRRMIRGSTRHERR